VENGVYLAPKMPGFSIEMKAETIKQFTFENNAKKTH